MHACKQPITAAKRYMWRAEDGAVPVGHHNVVAIRETVGARAIAETCARVSRSYVGRRAFLTLFEFFQETERAWKHSTHVDVECL